MTEKESWIINQFIAHRGFFDKENPENTLGAFQRAVENNFAIECDLRLLADGNVVVFHDKRLSRLTSVDGYIETLTLDEIKNLKVNNSNFGIPTLQEMLSVVNGQVPILFEIRNFSRKKIGELESKLCEILKDYKGNFAVQSYNPFVLEWFKINHPEIMRGIVSSYFQFNEDFEDDKTSWVVRYVLKHMKMNKKAEPNFIAYYWKNLPNRFVKKYKELPVLAWTIKSQEEYLKVVKHADNIIFEGFEPKI